MHDLLIPIDIEDALQKDITEAAERSGLSISVSAPPIARDLGGGRAMPYAVVERLGGVRSSLVLDKHAVSVDVWDKRWALAQDTASKLLAIILALPDTPDMSVDYISADVDTIPYNNPDVKHEDLPRVTFTVQLTTRATAQAID